MKFLDKILFTLRKIIKEKPTYFWYSVLEFRNTFKRNVVDKWEKYAQKQK